MPTNIMKDFQIGNCDREMNATSPLGKEQIIRSFLEGVFGASLRKRKLIVGRDSNKKPQIHEFDLVSNDMRIVGEIKSGRLSHASYIGALSDCLFLTRLKAKKKILVLTNNEFYQYFKTNSEGIISPAIDVMLLRPEELITNRQKVSGDQSSNTSDMKWNE
jgi:hypothetical protein